MAFLTWPTHMPPNPPMVYSIYKNVVFQLLDEEGCAWCSWKVLSLKNYHNLICLAAPCKSPIHRVLLSFHLVQSCWTLQSPKAMILVGANKSPSKHWKGRSENKLYMGASKSLHIFSWGFRRICKWTGLYTFIGNAWDNPKISALPGLESL